MNTILKLDKLKASIENKLIINEFNLTVNEGEIHVIMGPNGSGKSTLSKVLAGHEDYEVSSGSALLDGEEILGMEPDAISRLGLFLAFQNHTVLINPSLVIPFFRFGLSDLGFRVLLLLGLTKTKH